MHTVEKILNNTTPYGKIRASHEGSLHSSTLKYGYEGYRQFPLPESKFISRGAAEGNKHGRGAMDTACIPK